jgi:hypothetical protein
MPQRIQTLESSSSQQKISIIEQERPPFQGVVNMKKEAVSSPKVGGGKSIKVNSGARGIIGNYSKRLTIKDLDA